jgi:hypothetical protein
VPQAVECLLCKWKALSLSKPQSHPHPKKIDRAPAGKLKVLSSDLSTAKKFLKVIKYRI